MAGVVPPGRELSRERHARFVRRHHHVVRYAAVVLRGGYIEAGDRGRFAVTAGDVLLHDAFEAHQDHFGASGADILNLLLPHAPEASFGRTEDLDRIVRMGEVDAGRAAAILLEEFIPAFSANPCDWPDLLADDIRHDRVGRLADWADRMDVSPSSVSRGFRLAYGVSPQRYRAEWRAGEAVRSLRSSSLDLASIAVASGFADQPHMTRTVTRLFGRSPARLRIHMSNAFKTRPGPSR